MGRPETSVPELSIPEKHRSQLHIMLRTQFPEPIVTVDSVAITSEFRAVAMLLLLIL